MKSKFVLLTLVPMSAAAQVNWFPSAPGAPQLRPVRAGYEIGNRALAAVFSDGGGLRRQSIRSNWKGGSLGEGEVFRLYFRDGTQTPASKLEVVQPLKPFLIRGGKELQAVLRDTSHNLDFRWEVILPDGAHYLRQQLTLEAGPRDVDIARVVFGEGARGTVLGSVPGSPVVGERGTWFAGFEHPMSEAKGSDSNGNGDWSISISRKIPLKAGQSVTYSSVFGVSPAGQLRRSFLAYLERERPRKYEPFLHYNSWYDLGFFTKYTADQCVERIETFGEELARKRQVALKSFLFDDGWDDTSTIWEFHSGFPRGFLPLKEAAQKFGAAPGIWLSPWGGYGGPRQQRLATGRAAGMEIDSQGYALSGPKYYDRFHHVCLDLVGKYGINQFKFDGTGSPDKQYPGSQFASDFEAAISLIHDLREAKPGLFINLTTGTWPSPFWTRYADSIWRGGSDHSFAGVGPKREQWITYRDGDTFHGIVQKGPLYPLNSLMLHGLIYAQHANGLNDDPSGAFQHEVQSYFATGTQLEEMYITPALLTQKNWDDLANAAKWAYSNRDVLVDSHWVGGDPNDLDVYGWASWSPREAILTLRNPSDRPQAFAVSPQRVFELPPGVKGSWRGRDSRGRRLEIRTGDEKVIVLAPFEVQTWQGEVR